MLRMATTLVIASIMGACAFTPHEVDVTARAPTETSTIGEGVVLDLQVIDDRDTTVVGQRGGGMQGADITAGQVIPVLERELKAGFEAKSFTISPGSGQSDAEVEARLRAFKFFIETGFFTGAENTSVVVAIEAEKNGEDFDRNYRASSEEDAFVVPEGEDIDAKLNAALSAVLSKIMNDEELMNFLAQGANTR